MAYNPNNPNGQTTSANSAPVVIASDQSAVPIADGGGSITVDGSVSVSNFPATQPVSGSVTVSGTVTANAGTGTQDVNVTNASIPVTDNGGSLTVDGSVSVSNFPATQPVSGSVTVSGTVTADTELPNAAALVDATSNPTTPIVGAAMEAFNGTTWDRIRTQDALSGNGANDTTVGILAVSAGPGYAIRYNPTNLGTAANSASTINVEGANSVTYALSTTTTGTITFEGTADNTNWVAIEVFDSAADLWVSGTNITPTLGKVYQLLTQGYRQVRMRTVTTLGTTVSHTITLSTAQQFLGGIDTGAAPHNFGYSTLHKDGEYSTTQTTTALWTPTTGKKFVVTDLTISTGGTTAGIVTLFDSAAATAYSVGVTPAIFRGEFAPSTNSKPGAIKPFPVPYVSTTANNRLHVTTSAAITIYVQVNGYEI
jgi:hypothetical protein